MHREAFDFVERAAKRVWPVETVVEFGSLDVNGSAREAVPQADVEWVGIDRCAGPGVDLVLDLEQDDLELEDFDLGVCCETLEHVMAVGRVVDLLIGAVKVGGYVLITCATEPRATHSADGGLLHEREWYKNVAPWELHRPNLRVELFEVHTDRGDLYMLAERTA